jgi:hypothetical protein
MNNESAAMKVRFSTQLCDATRVFDAPMGSPLPVPSRRRPGRGGLYPGRPPWVMAADQRGSGG